MESTKSMQCLYVSVNNEQQQNKKIVFKNLAQKLIRKKWTKNIEKKSIVDSFSTKSRKIYYPSLPNKRAVLNNRPGWNFPTKLINVQGGIIVQGGFFSS